MSRCPICELKAANCDCSNEARELYELKEETEKMKSRMIDIQKAIAFWEMREEIRMFLKLVHNYDNEKLKLVTMRDSDIFEMLSDRAEDLDFKIEALDKKEEE